MALVALVIGAICIRLKEIYFSFVTLALQMLIYSLIIAWVPLTGGDQGLLGGIPRPAFLGIDAEPDRPSLRLQRASLLIAGLLILRHIVESPFGYHACGMIRDNADRAAFLGINVFRVKLAAFVIAGVFAGVGGIIMACSSPAPIRSSPTGRCRARRCS